MLFRIFIKKLILTSLFLASASDVGATLILGYSSGNDDFITMEFSDPNFPWSREIVEANEWPSSSKRDESEHQINFSDLYKNEEGAEVACINTILKRVSAKNEDSKPPHGLSPAVIWVPTTFWEIYVIRHYTITNTFWLKNNINQSPFYNSIQEENLTETEVKLQKEFVEYFHGSTQETLASLIKDQRLIKKIIVNLLTDILNADPREHLGPEIKSKIEIIKRVFQPEVKAINDGKSSFLISSIKVEIEAYQKNLALLWRSTNGLIYSEEYDKIPSVQNEILDFPALSHGPLKSLTLPITKIGFLKNLGLSFAYSPLAGFLLDGIHSKASACTFVYSMRDNFKYTYYLMLNKNWLKNEGKNYFFIPNTRPSAGIFSIGEDFHPRTYITRSQYLQGGYEFSIPVSTVSPDPFVADRNTIDELKAILASYCPTIPKSLNDEFANLLIASVNFDSQLGKILADEAKIFKIDNRIIEDPKLDPESQTILFFQKEASKLLEQKLRWLFIHQQLKNEYLH